MQNKGSPIKQLFTRRLCLRGWQSSDSAPFVQLNADVRVRAHFPSLLSATESDRALHNFQQHIEATGWGLWAAELLRTQEFIGFIGLQPLADDLPCAPGVEIGWRLAAQFWGHGYATEGAREVLRFGFEDRALEEIVSLTTTTNLSSQRVMQRIGMMDARANFLHPRIPSGHRLAEHVLYRLTRDNWMQAQQRSLR